MRTPLRSLLFAGAAALPFLTGGCSSTGTLDPAAIAAAAQAACGFLPLIASVTAVLNANGTITSVESAVKLICDSFKAQTTSASSHLRAPAPGQQITIDVDVGNGKHVPCTGTVV